VLLVPRPVWFSPPVESVDGERLGILQETEADGALWRYIEFRAEEQPAHKLLGYPRQSQGDLQLQCEVESLDLGWRLPESEWDQVRSDARDWRLLLQVDSDADVGISWCCCDSLYYMIREDDFRARRWHKTWVEIERS
jgi:hypothetical protein